MLIRFKSAPELGLLKVVSDYAVDLNSAENVCQACALEFSPICTTPNADGRFADTKCLSRQIHFVQVNPNE
jgi:hypothetical protein